MSLWEYFSPLDVLASEVEEEKETCLSSPVVDVDLGVSVLLKCGSILSNSANSPRRMLCMFLETSSILFSNFTGVDPSGLVGSSCSGLVKITFLLVPGSNFGMTKAGGGVGGVTLGRDTARLTGLCIASLASELLESDAASSL